MVTADNFKTVYLDTNFSLLQSVVFLAQLMPVLKNKHSFLCSCLLI